jgi:hypothetical protein
MRCSGGREAQFLWFLSVPFAAPLNAALGAVRCEVTYGKDKDKRFWYSRCCE